MDRRVKERLVGAAILAALIVSIVPELLPGPAPAPSAAKLPASTPEPVRNITVDLFTSKAPQPEPILGAASSAQPAEPRSTPPASAAATPPPPAHLETAPPAPTLPATAAKPVTSAGTWAVQLGSFASRANADKLMRQLRAQGFVVYVLSGGSGSAARYRVRVGPLADRGAAAQAVAKLKASGHSASVVPPAP